MDATASRGVRPVEARWQGYLSAVLAGALTALCGIAGLFAVLAAARSLPPPALANNLCIDEKLAFMRSAPPSAAVTTLVIGSSVAWRGVDSAVVGRSGRVPYNAGFCGLRLNQSAHTAAWLFDRLPAAREIILVASPQDFEGCSRTTATAFDTTDADRMVFRRAWLPGLYMRYFDPVSLLRNALEVAADRRDSRGFNPLVFTRFGDGPIETMQDRGLVYTATPVLDAACFDALRALAVRARQQDRHLVVVNAPTNPAWQKLYDPEGRVRDALNSGIDAALAGNGARHWDGDRAFSRDPSDFTDAIHIRWSAASRFTEMLVKNLEGATGAAVGGGPEAVRG